MDDYRRANKRPKLSELRPPIGRQAPETIFEAKKLLPASQHTIIVTIM